MGVSEDVRVGWRALESFRLELRSLQLVHFNGRTLLHRVLVRDEALHIAISTVLRRSLEEVRHVVFFVLARLRSVARPVLVGFHVRVLIALAMLRRFPAL